MTRAFSLLPFRAARSVVAATFLLTLAAPAAVVAQEEAPTPAEQSSEPADAAPAAEAATPAGEEAQEPAADAAPVAGAGATGTAATEPVPTIPVDAPPAEPVASQQLDTIEVTGSRIKRTDFETAQPVVVITREDIDRTGLSSIGDLLQDLAVAGSALGTTFNNGGTGAIEVDLRNLGSNRVLVLVNGHRWVNGLRSLGTNVVDLTTVPISLVERIEVLKDGASAIYGSDAIAGVINIITRKDYQGAEFRSYFGNYVEGNGLTQSHNVSWGNVAGETSLFLDLSFTRQDGIFLADTDQFKVNIPGTGKTRGSLTNSTGRFIFSPTPSNRAALSAVDPASCTTLVSGVLCDVTLDIGADGQNIANYHHTTFLDSYETSVDNYLVTPNERTSFFGQVSHKVSDAIQFNSELLYNLRRSRQSLAPMPLLAGDIVAFPPFGSVYIDATNIYNPFDQDIGRGAGGVPLSTGSGAALRRNIEGGRRVFRQDVDTLRGGVSLSGIFEAGALDVDRVVNWDVGYSYGESKGNDTSTGLVNVNRMRMALGPDVTCQNDPERQCVPLNLFGSGSLTREMLDYIMYTGTGTTRQVMRDAYANFSTDLVDFGTGMITTAFGIEYREEGYESEPDALVQQGLSSTNRAKPTHGAYDVKEYFLEFAVPIAADRPYIDVLDLSIAGRHSDYARYGKADTGKLGLRWKPINDVLVRATYSTSFRAPAVGELFLGNSDSFSGATDPCSAGGVNETATENCFGQDGLPPTIVQLLPQILDVFQGNQDLQPEEATTVTAGIVWSPEFIPEFNVYLDWYQIELDNYITIPGAQYLLDACYSTTTDQSKRRYCDQIKRDPISGQVTEILDPFLNFARLKTQGWDVTMDYRLPWLKEYGNFKVLADGTYLVNYDIRSEAPDGSPVIDEFAGSHGFFTAYPRIRATAALDWMHGDWDASWTMRYVHHVTEPCFDGLTPSLRDMGLCSKPDPDPNDAGGDESENQLESVLYHNVLLGYSMPAWNTKFELGVNNVLNQDPSPSFVFSPVYGYEPTMYEVPGRFPFVRLHKSF